jgi:hypothetical protein
MLRITEYADEQVFCLAIPEQFSIDDVQRYLDRFAVAVAREQPFGVIFFYQGGRPRKTRDAERLERAWLAEHRAALSRSCFGIAMVANPSVLAALAKIVLKGIGARQFGCSVTQVNSLDEARAWLRAQRASSGAMEVAI